MRNAFSKIFINRNLTLLFGGQMISQMGDSMFIIGMMWLVLDLTGSKTAMGTVAFVSHIPNLVLGLFAGIIVDTFNRKRIMLTADILRAIIVLAIPITFFLDVINLAVIMGCSFLLSLFASAFNPARDSILPVLVGKTNLLRANSVIQVSNYIAILLGPIIGAAAITAVGVVHLFTIDSLTFILSFAAVLFIKYRPNEKIEKEQINLRKHLKDIIYYVRQEKKLKILLGITAVNNFFIMGPAIVGLPIFVKDILNEGAASYALVEACYGIGMILGSILINYVNRFIGKGKILLIGLIFDGITFAVLLFINSLPLLMLSIAFHAIGIPFIVVARTSLIQEWTDDNRLGRVFSLVNIAVVGMTALTTGFTGILADFVSIDIIFAIFGTGGMLCGFVGYLYKDLREG